MGTIVIFQLQRYIMCRGNPIKDNRAVKSSSDPLNIHVSCQNTVSFSASFSLQATITVAPCKRAIIGHLKGISMPTNG